MAGLCETCIVPNMLEAMRAGEDARYQEGHWRDPAAREAVCQLAEVLLAAGECEEGEPAIDETLTDCRLISCENSRVNDVDSITTAMSELGSRVYFTILEVEKSRAIAF